MIFNEFIEKYKVDNFDSYLKEDATVEYWQELIVIYEIDKLNFQDYPYVFLRTSDPRLNSSPSPFSMFTFSEFCKNQIKIIEIRNQFKPKEVEVSISEYQHQDYFKGNSFEIWQKMYEDFKIDNPKESVDLDFMYAIMKDKGLIHKTIGLIDMQTWINKNYPIELSKLRFTNINQKSNRNRMIIFESITG